MSIAGRLLRTPRTVLELLRETRRYQRNFRVSYTAQLRRLIRLYVKEKYWTKEIGTLGIADPRIPVPDLQQYISKRALVQIQQSINGTQYEILTEDKAVFYALCDLCHIPTPKVHAFFSRHGGWLNDGIIVKGRDQWVDYFDRRAPREFIVKPSLGVYARGFQVFTKQGNGWVCKSGTSYTSCQLYECLAKDPDYDRFILQERITNHDAFTRISRSEALQTARIVTLMNRQREPRIINSLFKIVRGNNIADNFAAGETGNLLAKLDVDTGKVLAVVGKQNGSLTSITHDEETGISYTDFTVPRWAEAKELALQAATKFLPIQTIGWDVAITPTGPMVIEGNQRWDPGQNYFREGQVLRKQLSQVAASE